MLIWEYYFSEDFYFTIGFDFFFNVIYNSRSQYFELNLESLGVSIQKKENNKDIELHSRYWKNTIFQAI